MKTLLLLIFMSSSLFAAETVEFHADHYAKGFHLMAGGGVNAALYNSEISKGDFGAGLNVKTDLGYYFNSRFAIEASSNVAFNRVRENLVWNTLLTFGIRHRISKDYFGRLFYGESPTVIYTSGRPDIYRDRGATRLQYDGPVTGFSIGRMYETKRGRVWFVEYGFTYQYVGHQEGIADQNDVPTVVFSDASSHPIKVYSAFATIGVLVF